MIEYWYYRKEDMYGDYVEYISATKGKVTFKTEQEMIEGFPLHYPGCTIWSWNYEGEK